MVTTKYGLPFAGKHHRLSAIFFVSFVRLVYVSPIFAANSMDASPRAKLSAQSDHDLSLCQTAMQTFYNELR